MTTDGGNNSRAIPEAFEALRLVNLTEKIQSGSTRSQSHTMLAKDSFLGSLLVLPMELWNGLMDETTIKYTENRGHLRLSKLAVWVLCMGHRA